MFWVGIVLLISCSDDDDDEPNNDEVYVLDAKQCDPVEITIVADQIITLTTTDSVITNPSGSVVDCDYWTDADGIETCNYVINQPLLHGLPFMALIGNFNDGDWFWCGKDFDTSFATAGTLYLKVNDWGDCDVGSDNEGQFVITVDRE